MSVYVETNKPFLTDVGYGDLFVVPLEIRDGIQDDVLQFGFPKKSKTNLKNQLVVHKFATN